MRKVIALLAIFPLLTATTSKCEKERGGPRDTCTPIAMAPVSDSTSLVSKVTETGIRVIYQIQDKHGKLMKATFRIGYQINSTDGDVLLVNGVPFVYTRNRTFNTGSGTDTILYGSPGIQGRLTYHAVACVPGGSTGFIEVASLPNRKANLVAVEGSERSVVTDDGKKHSMEFRFATNVPTTLLSEIGPK